MKFIVAGQQRDSSYKTELRNPYNDELLATVVLATQVDAEEAISKTILAKNKLRALNTSTRVKILQTIAEKVAAHSKDLSLEIARQVAKPLKLSIAEVKRCVETFSFAAEACATFSDEVINLDSDGQSERRVGVLRSFPLSLALFITPFNFPLNLLAHKVAPAIACGVPFIIKPAPQAVLSALRLAELIVESGFPAEALSVIPCANEVAEQIVKDKRIQFFSFTGSARVGWYLKSLSQARRVVLECGGNAAVVIDDEIDDSLLDYAVERCTYGAFAYAGQICISVQRIFVQQKIYERFKTKFVKAAQQVKVGDPMHPDTDVSVLINDTAAKLTAERLQRALDSGATFALQGTQQGKLFTPYILENVTNDMEICQEELFAPIAVLLPYEKFDEALKLVNQSRYGLQAGVFTCNINKIMSAFNTLEVGAVIINDVPTYRHDKIPYGGFKESGLGREGPLYAMREMCEPRLLVLKQQF